MTLQYEFTLHINLTPDHIAHGRELSNAPAMQEDLLIQIAKMRKPKE